MKTDLAIAITCLLIALPAMAQRYVRDPIEPVGTHRKTAGQGHQAVCAADGQGSSKDGGRRDVVVSRVPLPKSSPLDSDDLLKDLEKLN
jgi:hypothetical protein